ncbi:MAG: hypothetical protein NTY35_15415 [Planctomycetota bacterium]|nr:hypothetical protein [Planctomycetota bacterium]
MPNPVPTGAPRRPAFLAPRTDPPFWRSPEFARFGLIALVALGGAGAFLYSQRIQSGLSAPAASGTAPNGPPLPATATLTPEQIAEREAYLASAFEGALRDQADAAEFQDSTGYRKLLEQVAKFDADDFSNRTLRHFDNAAALADPNAWRGQFVRVSGILGDMVPQRLALPTGGRKDAWRAQLGSGDEFSDRIVLEFLDRPFPDMSLKDLYWRAVEVEGVFYRTGTYVSDVVNSKGQTLEVTWTLPWIFVRNVRLIDEGGTPARTFLTEHPMQILALLAFVIFGGRLLVSWVHSRRRVRRQPKGPPSIRAMFDQKLREKGLPPAPPSHPQR